MLVAILFFFSQFLLELYYLKSKLKVIIKLKTKLHPEKFTKPKVSISINHYVRIAIFGTTELHIRVYTFTSIFFGGGVVCFLVF